LSNIREFQGQVLSRKFEKDGPWVCKSWGRYSGEIGASLGDKSIYWEKKYLEVM
jgi:hypothetical protein